MMNSIFSYRLTVVNGDAAGKEWRLFQEEVTLGRHDSNHLVFTHPTVSKQQCRIVAQNGQLRIENLSQSNKTKLNGTPVDEAGLYSGDIIQMGDVHICVSTHDDQVVQLEEDDWSLDDGDEPATSAILLDDIFSTGPDKKEVEALDEDEPPTSDDLPEEVVAVEKEASTLDDEPLTEATIVDQQAPSSSGSEPEATSSDDSASVTGQYTIESKIAQSGQAILFRGRNDASGESVAMKLFTHDETDEVSESRFQRELKMLKKLSHENIVGYRGLFETEGEWGDNKRYLVMEYLEGKTLSELIEENPKGMDWDTVRSIFEQCLQGLSYAYKEHNIIHRDLKPSNIFVLADGTAKLIDFGISRFDSESTHTGGSGMMGSFDYMAPDFALAEDAGFRGDRISDIFSVFVCMYHALTGTLPFPKYGERQELEYLNRWRSSDIKPPSHKHIIFRVIAHLGGFVDQGLAVDRTKRFQTFEEVLDALNGLKHRMVVHKKVDSYELLSGLGAGGFGEVYLGTRESDGEKVAIKRLHAGHSSKRFIKEATILSEYEHPALVKYLDFFETVDSSGGRSPFLVLEYLEGTTLSKQVAAHPEGMDTKEVLQLFLRYLAALDFLHNAKGSIIHRDIKPGNLHVPSDDPMEAKIFDLGIIKDLSGTQTSGKLPGTYYYMAPEMFTTDNRGTAQTDVYAMGLCLYEALTGSPAYPRLPKNDKEAIVEMIARAQGERRYRVSYNHRAFRDHPDLVRIVQQAINPDPKTRYADAKHMWDDIASVLELNFSLDISAIDEGVQASTAGAGKKGRIKPDKAVRVRPSRKKRRKRKARGAGVLVLILLLCGLYAAARLQLEKVEPVVKSWPEPWAGYVMQALSWSPTTSAAVAQVAEPTKIESTPVKKLTTEEEPVQPTSVVAKTVEPKPVVVKRVEPQPKAVELASDTGSEGVFKGKLDNILLFNRINCNSYEDAVDSVGRIADLYSDIIESEYAGKDHSYIKEGCKDFWAKQLVGVVDGYRRKKDYSLIAVANGLYLSSMQHYSRLSATKDVKAIQTELEKRMVDSGLYGAGSYFPVLTDGHFVVDAAAGIGASAWWQDYAPESFSARLHALYLPLRAERTLAISRGQTISVDMDYVLVPFNMLTDSTPVQGKRLKRKPLNPFYMATTETTGKQMLAYLSAVGRTEWPKGADPSEPYSYASLKEAIAFCNWLTEQDGLEPLYERKEDSSGWNLDLRKPGYRLPFDFEWEYAARFGYDFFPKSGESDWLTMKAELDRKVEDQASVEDINGGLVNYYYLSLRNPQEGREYPLGMYDLCGNASEICMTIEELPKEPRKVEVEFVQMLGGESISDIKAVAPWLSEGEPNGVGITDKDKAGYGFRVIRTVPVYLFK